MPRLFAVLLRCLPWTFGTAVLAVFAGAGAGIADEVQAEPALRFSPASFQAEKASEQVALAVPSSEYARRWLRILTTEPHVAGTGEDYRTAVFVCDKLKEWGWDAKIVELKVLLNYPSREEVEPSFVYDNDQVKQGTALSLQEPALPRDHDSGNSACFPGFHGYGASGTAHGRVVYANYGRLEDFQALADQGVEVRNRIVLVRYGAIFRGLKVQNAQKQGASGILIYSDPADDGYVKGEVYPDGPYRPGGSLQRGSVQFLSMGPGDPSTPLGPSAGGARRIPFDPVEGLKSGYDDEWSQRTGIARDDYVALIPSLPIGYDAAQLILKKLAGPVVPSGWQGGLPLTYHVGPGPAFVRMTTRMEYAIRPIWNVIATIAGSDAPERWVMLGNHRDAWVYGAVDPGSGTAATLEACRALGAAAKHGWKPRRTLVYASWDAEEYGLVGSTEWAEEHARELREKAALMLNVDSAVSGHELDASGVPSLRDLFLDAARAISDPRTGKSLAEGWISKKRNAWASESPLALDDAVWRQAKLARHSFHPLLGSLGSGSDYTVFLDHLGIPCLDVGFKGPYGVYHSIYDDFHWMEKHGDPGFLTHPLAARLYALILMRAAAAPVLPVTFQPYALALKDHVDGLRTLEARYRRKQADGAQHDGSFVGLDRLIAAVAAFSRTAETLDAACAKVAALENPNRDSLTALNEALIQVERAFLLEDGLAGRPWFKHSVYAPGLTTGYGSWPLPAIRQVLEEHAESKVKEQVDRTVACLESATRALGLALERANLATR